MNDLQKLVHDCIMPYGGYWPLDTICLRLAEEVGEVNRARRKETPERVAEEIGDVMFTLVCLANAMNFDLDQIIGKCVDSVSERLNDSGVDYNTGRLK